MEIKEIIPQKVKMVKLKVVKKVIILVLLVAISIGLLVVGNGYDMYKEALEQMPLEEKIESIREKENYTKQAINIMKYSIKIQISY